MAIIKLSGNKVLLKNGKPSCECCDGSVPPTGPSVGCADFSNSPCTEGAFISYETALAFASASSVSSTINVSGAWNYISSRLGPNTQVSVVINESQSWSRNKASQCATGPNTIDLNPSTSSVTETYDNGAFTATSSMNLFAEASLGLREIGSPRNFCLTATYFFEVRASGIVRVYGPDGSFGGIGSVSFSGVGVSLSGPIQVQYLGNAATFPSPGTTPSGSVTATISTSINVAPP